MTRESITAALDSEGLGAGPQGYVLPDNREATCLVAAPGDVFSVDRLVRIDLKDKFILLENGRHERFFFAYEDVLGLKLLAAPAAKDRVAGFGGR
jgi:hypothetical protein